MINQIIFEDEDIELLNKALPDFPCKNCSYDSYSCCGCYKEKEYYKIIKKYQDKGIYDIAILIQHLRKIQIEKNKLEIEYNLAYKNLKKAMKKDLYKIKL